MVRIRRLLLPQDHVTALEAEARRRWPVEACGLLLGVFRGDEVHVQRIELAENAAHSPVTFQIDPQRLIQIYEEAERTGMDVVCVYHSHPAPPYPSGTDVQFMQVNPVAWLIVSMPEGSYRAFQWVDGRVEHVDVTVR